MKNKEIERKWLVPAFPNIFGASKKSLIETIYPFVSDDFELRVQKKSNTQDAEDFSYKLTTKFGNGLVRDEIETSLTRKEYRRYLSYVTQAPIIKTHYEYIIGNFTFHFSLVHSYADFESWFYMEIEFDTPEAANSFQIKNHTLVLGMKPTDFFEVTGIPEYAMKNYWVRTRLNK